MLVPTRVHYSRINRRLVGDEPVRKRPLSEDIAALVEAQNTHADEAEREWVVTDLQFDPSEDFVTGMLGLIDQEWRRSVDLESFSLIKGERQEVGGASERAISPFAIDVREGRRWVAWAKAPRLSVSRFNYGLGAALNAGVMDLELWPRPWDVDSVVSSTSVRQWLRENPRVAKFRRTVMRSNPGRDLDDDRAAMKALNARRLTEEIAPPPNESLSLTDLDGDLKEVVDRLLQGLASGDLHVYIESRGDGDRRKKYNSRQKSDETWISSFGDNFEAGLDAVLDALREYSERRAQEEPSPFVDDVDDVEGDVDSG